MATDHLEAGGDSARADRFIGWWSLGATLLLISIWNQSVNSDARYILYLLTPLLLLFYLVHRDWRIEIDPRPARGLLLYFAVLGITLLYNRSLGSLATRDILIIGSYLLVFSFRCGAPSRTVDVLLVGLFISMLLEHRPDGVHLSFNPLGSGGLMDIFAGGEKRGVASSSEFAFPIGAILLYYIDAKRWRAALIAGFLVFVAFKRIALLGVLAAVAVDRGLVLFGWSAIRRLIVPAVGVGCALLALFSVAIFEFAATQIHQDSISADSFSMGRFQFAQALWHSASQAPLGTQLFGSGPGTAEETIHLSLEYVTNLHNDWLKIFFEYGIVGFAAFQVIVYSMFPKTRLGCMMYLYTCVLFMSDNTLIYTYQQICVLLVLRAASTTVSVQAATATIPQPAGRLRLAAGE